MLLGLIGLGFWVFINVCVVVPQKSAYIVQRFGKYHKVLDAGLHFLIPFADSIAYRHTLKEQALDVAPQTCITRDNITVTVDGILYLQVMDAGRASYGINDYQFASTQIAQTTMRSIIGKMDLDKTFEEREAINSAIVQAVDKASDPWGVKVTRYEVKNIVPPQSIKDAMEKQMRAEREKRAMIAESEGEKQAKINRAEGQKQETIAYSEAEKQKRINEAEGSAFEIENVAKATAEGIREIANAINQPGGREAVNLRIAEEYLQQFGKLASKNNTMIIPSNLSDIAGVVATAKKVLDEASGKMKGENIS
ncbi:MAG TPA: stomatin-like protein [Candidatus Omnitrophota bacterium]|nr:stomatin-like protein [Candidatus Omnitrophota bacterium]HSA31542.1 stomatin-like protein [Candidatus Omnitrophota bacterium]